MAHKPIKRRSYPCSYVPCGRRTRFKRHEIAYCKLHRDIVEVKKK